MRKWIKIFWGCFFSIWKILVCMLIFENDNYLLFLFYSEVQFVFNELWHSWMCKGIDIFFENNTEPLSSEFSQTVPLKTEQHCQIWLKGIFIPLNEMFTCKTNAITLMANHSSCEFSFLISHPSLSNVVTCLYQGGDVPHT